MTKMCETCMAREADPSEYHDDACPVFQEQAAWRVGYGEGYRAGIEAAATWVMTRSGMKGPYEMAVGIRALSSPPPPATAPERGALPCPVCDDGIEEKCPRCGREPNREAGGE